LAKKKSPISKRLKEARLTAGLSQKTLGIKAGIDQFSASARMNQYETDKHVPDFGTVQRIARVLNIPPAYFYCDDEDLASLIAIWPSLTRKERMAVKALLMEKT